MTYETQTAPDLIRRPNLTSIGLEPETDAAFSLNFSWLRSIIWQSRFQILGIVVVALALGLAMTLLSNKVYRAQSSIHLEQSVPTLVTVAGSGETTGVSPTSFGQYAATQIRLIESRSTASEVVRQNNLVSNKFFLESAGIDKIEGDRRNKDVAGRIERRAIGFVNGAVKVEADRGTELAIITADTNNPKLSAMLANLYADVAVKLDLQRQFDRSKFSREFLLRQLGTGRERLEASEIALNNYARESGIVTAGGGGGGDAGTSQSTVTISSLGEISTAANEAGRQRLLAEQVYQVAAGAPLMTVPQVMNSPQVQGLQQQRAQAEAKLSQDQLTYGKSHPITVQDRAAVDSVRAGLLNAARDVMRSLRLQYEAAVQTEQALRSRVSQLQGNALDEGRLGVRYNFLKRDVDTNRALFDAVLQRQKELTSSVGFGKSNISIVDNATPSGQPISPNLSINLLVALVGGLFAGMLFALLRAQADQRLRTPEAAALATGLPILGVIPQSDGNESMLEKLTQPRSTVAEAYFSVRASLSLASTHGVPKTLLVTSGGEGEGKSTTAFALALSSARLGKRVLIIDADMRRPSLHRILSIPNGTGLADVLSSNAKFADVILDTEFPNLFAVPSGPIPPSPTELLSGSALENFLNQARAEFDFVVIDSPPVLGLADALLLSANVEAVMFIAEARRTTRAGTRKVIERLSRANAHLIGVVVTKFVASQQDGYDYYQNYYSYGSEAGTSSK